LDEPSKAEVDEIEVLSKKIAEIKPEDNLVTINAKKGPESDIVNFSRKDGSTGSVKRVVIFDDSGETILVLWDDAIALLDEIQDEPFEVNKLRVNMSRYNTIELHTVTGTVFTPLETSQISQEPPIRNIEELQSHQGMASVQGVVQQVSEVREFNRADGTTGRVASMEIEDTTGSCRIVAWDYNVEKLNAIREKDLKYAKIFFGQMRQTDDESVEIHLSPQSHVRPSSRIPVSLRNIEIKAVEEVTRQPPLDYQKTHLSNLAGDEDGTPVEILGKVIRLFQQSPYYMACPECRKKVVETGEGWECETHQAVKPNITMKLSGLIDDGTGTVKATFFGRSGEKMTGLRGRDIQQMLEHDLTDDEIFTAVQKEAEGKTILIQGRLQLQTREIEGETMQSQTLFANRVIFPNPKALSEELISQLSHD
jgi:ssDNA-binding replication factor A large subunit